MEHESHTTSPQASPNGSSSEDARRFGLLAQFNEPERLRIAARRTRDAGYRKIEAYSPFPIEGLSDIVRKGPSYLPYITLGGGILGALTAYGMQYYAAVIDYPFNVGGRPPHSWPSFIPITFELTVLFAAISAVVGMFALNRLPKPYHPLFNVPDFARATQDKFFLCIDAGDEMFDFETTRDFLNSLNPEDVYDVPK